MSKAVQGLMAMLCVAFTGIVVGTLAPSAAAQTVAAAEVNSIESIDATQTSTGVVLSIVLKNAATGIPASFSVANPARIALDLPATNNGTGKNLIELNQGDLRSVNLVQAQGRVRVVLNLRRTAPHAVTVEGNRILVAMGGANDTTTFRPAPVASATGTDASPTPVPPAVGTRSLRGIDFRRGSDGEGRVVVDLSDPNTNVDIKQQGNTVVVDFLNTTLPDSLKRRLDVSDFGTPVVQMSASQQGTTARLIIEPRGTWEQNAYQSDTRFVVEVKPVKEDPSRMFQTSRQGYQGERLSLNFQNVDVRSLLQVIADFTNLNIITSDSVGGTITLRLKDVPWDQALDLILQSKGLDMRKNGNVVLVAPREEIATREKLDLEARAQISELEPIRSEVFVINYQKADDVRKLLTDDKQRIISKRGSVGVDARTNQVFVQDTAPRLEDVRRLIARIDVAVPQVLIEARIVEASDTFSRNLGVKFGIGAVGAHGAVGQNVSVTPGSGTTAGSVSVTNPNFVNLPASGLNGFDAGVANLTLFNGNLTRLLNLELSALEADGRGKIISSPRVVTADKVKATIEQGTEIPYQQATSSGATSVSFRKAVLKLEVTPQITPEGAIFLDVKVNKDSRGVDTSAGPAIDTKNVQTQVLVENGGTVVLGGIYEQTDRTTTNQVPLLGDIPVIGWLFKNRSTTNDRTELLIFITPRVLSERVTAAVRQ